MQKPKQVYTTFIRTTPKKLWEAITKPEFTRQYWAGVENVSDWKKGAKWEHIGGEEKREVWITGKVLESTPPKRLVLSWAEVLIHRFYQSKANGKGSAKLSDCSRTQTRPSDWLSGSVRLRQVARSRSGSKTSGETTDFGQKNMM